MTMKRKHQKTVEQIYKRPTSANIQWNDIEALFVALGAKVTERNKGVKYNIHSLSYPSSTG